MKKNNKSKLTKNIVTGFLLVGGVAAGLIGANIISHASENSSIEDNNIHENEESNEGIVEIAVAEIKDDDELEALVLTEGPQVILDDKDESVTIAFINDNNELQVSEVTSEELGDLINKVNELSNGEMIFSNVLDTHESY